jgi:hypothetical protein
VRLLALVVALLLAFSFVMRVRVDSPRVVERGDGTSDARVDNVAIRGTADEVERAIEDVKTVGLWDDLTDDLYEVRISTEPHATDIPQDGHLAHAYLTGVVDEQGSGGQCDITFFPAAMDSALELYERWKEDGKIDTVPTRRQFWAQILGHELAHCLGDGQDEGVAQIWEREVLDRLIARGIRT